MAGNDNKNEKVKKINKVKIETVKSTGQDTKTGADKKLSPIDRYRFPIVAGMCVFVIFVMIWSFTQTVKGINLEKNSPTGSEPSASQQTEQPKEDEAEPKKEEVKSGKDINMAALAKKLIKGVSFETKLAKLDDSVASGMIATADGTELMIYMGNGSSADELILMKAGSESAAEENMGNAEAHLKELQQSLADYLPEEAKKIDSAVKVQSGAYVFVCVTADSEKAKKLINNAVK